MMKDYGVYKNDLDALTMEMAKEIEATCENDALDLAKKSRDHVETDPADRVGSTSDGLQRS